MLNTFCYLNTFSKTMQQLTVFANFFTTIGMQPRDGILFAVNVVLMEKHHTQMQCFHTFLIHCRKGRSWGVAIYLYIYVYFLADFLGNQRSPGNQRSLRPRCAQIRANPYFAMSRQTFFIIIFSGGAVPRIYSGRVGWGPAGFLLVERSQSKVPDFGNAMREALPKAQQALG